MGLKETIKKVLIQIEGHLRRLEFHVLIGFLCD